MSTGKYSPLCPNSHENYTFFKFNCYGEVPESWNEQVRESGVEYNSVTMFEDYDSEGFDRDVIVGLAIQLLYAIADTQNKV